MHHQQQPDFFSKRQDFFLEMPQRLRLMLTVFAAIGVLAFTMGMLSGAHARTWGSFLFNCLFFFSLAIGGVAFGHMQDIIDAHWGRPIKRMHEAFASFIPVAVVALIAFILCIKLDILNAKAVYSWIQDPHLLHHFPGKRIWLQENFMLIRVVVSLLVIAGLAHWQMKLATERDLAFVKGDKDAAEKLGEKNGSILHYWSAPVLVVYSICFSIIAFDMAMALAPTWFSTLWAGWMFAVMMQTLMAANLLMMFYLKKTKVGEFIGRQQFHDVGKLMHGFTIFFAYLTYAHVLTYWYTNIPEETSFFLDRMQKPWLYLLILAPLCSFFIPVFALVPKAAKWTARYTIPIACLILFAQWLAYFLVVMPEVDKELHFPWIEVGLCCGFLALFLGSFFRFAKRIPMLPLADPLLKDAFESH